MTKAHWQSAVFLLSEEMRPRSTRRDVTQSSRGPKSEGPAKPLAETFRASFSVFYAPTPLVAVTQHVDLLGKSHYEKLKKVAAIGIPFPRPGWLGVSERP